MGIFLSRHCHCTSYLTCHTIPHICAPILLILHPFLKIETRSTCCKQTLEVQWSRRKTVHTIGIEQAQTGDVTSNILAVTETFLSVQTSSFNYA